MCWRCATIYFKIVLWSSGCPYTVEGLEQLDPNGNYFFASNHESLWDVPLIFAGCPPPSDLCIVRLLSTRGFLMLSSSITLSACLCLCLCLSVCVSSHSVLAHLNCQKVAPLSARVRLGCCSRRHCLVCTCTYIPPFPPYCSYYSCTQSLIYP